MNNSKWKLKTLIALTALTVVAVPVCLQKKSANAASKYTYKKGFTYETISPKIEKRITGKSYRKNKNVKLSDLRYVQVLHYGFDGKVKHGELIVNKKIAKKTVKVFYELYQKKYRIQRMRLIDDYNANDNKSMSANNTSAFNYRVISGTKKLSNHSYGLAIDINPRINPWVKGNKVSPSNGKVYKQRKTSKCKGKYKRYMIHKNDTAYKIFKKYGFSWGIPLFLIAMIGIFRMIPSWAEAYACLFYPFISTLLSAFSSLFPFSVGDCFIVGTCLWILIYPFYAWRKRKGAKKTVGTIIRVLMWVYIWFYFAWGLNYFRFPFYERTGIAKAAFSAEKFQDFLTGYVGKLNESYSKAGDTLSGWYLERYTTAGPMSKIPVAGVIQEGYGKMASRFGLVEPGKFLRVKPMLWSRLMSRVAVTGYMGPFFTEFNLNQELLSVEYPFTYAHELAHRLGIASEAEANLYAYLVTSAAQEPAIRFSGYFSMLGYVVNNARRLLTEEQYQEIVKRIRPEIVELYNSHLLYWREKYNPGMGQIQHQVYNAYLKGNQVSSGTKNYSEVIGLLMSLQEDRIVL